jgi:squalene-associated FAD-dependent desaturase
MSGRIVVIGGGLAGITAALDCAGRGASVTLVEVRPRLGGAAYSFARDGLSLDNGQHVFLRCCTAYRHLLERLGATGGVVLQRRLDIPVLAPGGRRARLRRSAFLPAPLHLASALAGYRLLPARDRAAAVRTALALRRLDLAEPGLDDRALGAWLDEHGQGPRAQSALWDLIARPALNVPAREASLALGAFVFRTGLLDRADAGDIGWARVPLSQLHDEPARRALAAAGVDVRLGWRATRIVAERGGVRAVEGPDGRLEADAVVLAVPHERAAGLAPEGALRDPDGVAALGRSPIVNLHVVFDRRVLDVPFAAGVDTPVQYVFDRTASSGVPRGQLLAISLSAADEEAGLGADELRARYVPALEELLPAARGARVEAIHVTREHAATFRAAPGTARRRPGPRTGVAGLAVAGAWTDTGWPATMEGAVRSGAAAAAEVLATLGVAPGQANFWQVGRAADGADRGFAQGGVSRLFTRSEQT